MSKTRILLLALMLNAPFCYANTDDSGKDKGYDPSLEFALATCGTFACADGVRRIWFAVKPCSQINTDEEARLFPVNTPAAQRSAFEQIRFGLGEIIAGGAMVTGSWISMGLHSHK